MREIKFRAWDKKDTQQVSFKPSFWVKVKRYFNLPRLYVSLLESKDRKKAIFLRGFNKYEGSFMMDRFDVQEKENVEAYWVDSVGVWELIKGFFKALWENK